MQEDANFTQESWFTTMKEQLNATLQKSQVWKWKSIRGPKQPDKTSCGLYVALFTLKRYSSKGREYNNWFQKKSTFWRIHFLNMIFKALIVCERKRKRKQNNDFTILIFDLREMRIKRTWLAGEINHDACKKSCKKWRFGNQHDERSGSGFFFLSSSFSLL